MHIGTDPVALGDLQQLHDWFRDSGNDEYYYLDIRDYDVAALASNLNLAFPHGINNSDDFDEPLTAGRQYTDSQQIVGSLEIGDFYNKEPDSSNLDHRINERRKGCMQKVSLEWVFVITNFILELPSVVLDQLSSVYKPQYTLFAMLISFAALLICIIELIYKVRKEKNFWRWRGLLPWFYNASQNYKPFGTFKDIVGSVCALCQCIVTTVNFARTDINKISVWPIILAFGLLCSKMLENPERERRTAV